MVEKRTHYYYVHAMHHLGAISMSNTLEHILFSVGGQLAWPISTEVKEVI